MNCVFFQRTAWNPLPMISRRKNNNLMDWMFGPNWSELRSAVSGCSRKGRGKRKRGYPASAHPGEFGIPFCNPVLTNHRLLWRRRLPSRLNAFLFQQNGMVHWLPARAVINDTRVPIALWLSKNGQPARARGNEQQIHHSVWPRSRTGNNPHFRIPLHNVKATPWPAKRKLGLARAPIIVASSFHRFIVRFSAKPQL